MNRDIEFRGKSPDDGEWYFGCLVKMKNGQTEIWTNEIDDVICMINVIPETVGQYTGLKDKNGVKIFEGDIVFYKDIRFPVRWDNEKAGFFIGKDKYWMMNDMNLEVIGNIHYNPELLGG